MRLLGGFAAISDEDLRFDRLVEINVAEQV